MASHPPIALGPCAAKPVNGDAQQELEALDKAIDDLNEDIRIEPDHVDAHWARGDCHRYNKEHERVIADFDTALAACAPAYRGRGAAFRMKGELERTIADYGAALRLNPEDPLAHRFQDDAYVARGNYDHAISDFDVSLKSNCSDEFAYLGGANAQFFLGELTLQPLILVLRSSAIPRMPALSTPGVARDALGDSEWTENDYRLARELGYDSARIYRADPQHRTRSVTSDRNRPGVGRTNGFAVATALPPPIDAPAVVTS